MSKERDSVRQFYDTYGWEEDDEGRYQDTKAFVDNRDVMAAYHGSTMERLKSWIPTEGRYFLDAGSGALVHPVYEALSEDHEYRVCMDFAWRALEQARRRRGQKKLFTQADITRIPFPADSIDTILCAHVLYHIPADEQAAAVLEMYRVLKPGGRLLIIYTNPRCFMNRLGEAFNPRRIAPSIPGARLLWRMFVRRLSSPTVSEESKTTHPPLYFYSHGSKWFEETFSGELDYEVKCLASIGLPFSQAFVFENILGKGLVRIVRLLERFVPVVMSRVGAYPCYILFK